ncbi:MAG: TIGR02186 family protein [Bacillota bacterium]
MLKAKEVRTALYRPVQVCLVCLLALALALTLFPRVSAAGILDINDPQVDSSSLFSGAKLTFSGSVDEECDVIIKVVGPGKKVVLGNDGLVPSHYSVVDNLPRQYKILSSCGINDIAPEIKNTLGLTNDFSVLRNKAVAYLQWDEKKVPQTGPEREKQINKAILVNEQNGHYRFIENSIQIEGGEFKGTLHVGRREYSPRMQVQVIALKDNVVVDQKIQTVSVPLNFFTRPIDIEKEPFLFTGIFFCLTILAVTGVDEIIGRRARTAFTNS